MKHPPIWPSRALLLTAGLLVFFLQSIHAQNITYENPAAFFACGNAPFEITVSNPTGGTIQDVSVTVQFSSSQGSGCGIAYLPGTIGGAGEGDISNLSAPVFQVGNLLPGASQVLTLQAHAPCATVTCIDNAALFFNEITMTWSGGSTSATTLPYVVETALLVITQVSNPVMTGTRGDVLQRKITIRNTRPGALQSFVFTDTHQPGISISSPQGTDVSSGNTFQIELGSDDFAAIGNGNGLFEFNEVIAITENILITDCGVDVTSAASSIKAGWGCGGEICQEVPTSAVVLLQPDKKAPKLTWLPITQTPECFCGPEAHRQGMVITNTGDGPATEITLNVLHPVFEVDMKSVVADSAGILIGVNPQPVKLQLFPSDCVGPDSVAMEFFVTVPALAPGHSVTVYWDVYFCRRSCEQPTVLWEYKYSYFKDCPPNPFVLQEEFIKVSENGKFLLSSLLPTFTGPMMDGMHYKLNYLLNYDSTTLLDDEMIVHIELPCGMIWDDDNDLILGGKSPVDATVTFLDGKYTVTAIYQLPLDVNPASMPIGFTWDCGALCLDEAICQDSVETSCEVFLECQVTAPTSARVTSQTTILKCPDSPVECNLQSCFLFEIPYDCPLDTFCIEQPPGYVRYGFDAYRLNLGLPDNDNDRYPDGFGQINPDLIRRDRFIAGDTLRVTIRGEVVNDLPVELPFGNIQIGLTASNVGFLNFLNLLKEGTGIQQAGAVLRIYDKSAGTYYQCNNPVPAIENDGPLTYQYDLSAQALGSCVPSGFAFSDGDSILFDANYRIRYNLLRDAVPDPDPLLAFLSVTPSVVVFNSDTTDYRPLHCGCGGKLLEVSGYEFSILPGLFGLPPCGNSSFLGGSLFQLLLEKGNFFPYEYRNILALTNWVMEFPPSVGLVETRMTFLRFQDGANIATNQTLVPVFANGMNTFSLGQYQNPPLDEGFSALFQYIFDNDCTISGSLPLKLTARLDFADGIPEPVDPLDYTVQANALRPLVANLKLDLPLTNIVSFSNQLALDFDFINFPTIVGSLSSGAAPNTWLYVTSPTGLVTNFQLLNMETGLLVPSINGVFQLGDFPIDTLPFRLLAQNNSCQTENFQIHFGWSCTPFTSTVQTPCNAQVQPITVLSPPGELDILVTSPTTCADLCDTIPYHTIEVFNAELGALYEVSLLALFPPGISVLPGTSQVEYPTGSGLFYPIGDPDEPVMGAAVWNLSALFDSLAVGLPGVASAPANSVTLYFLSATNCDFVANAQPIFIAYAEQNCGVPSNTVAKPGDPICILGVDPPFSTSVNVQAVPGFACNDEVVFEVSLTSDQMLPAGAFVIVTLPLGVSYVPGSCSSACQANFNCLPTVTGNTFTWELPVGVPSNQIVCFSFTTNGWDGLGCGSGVVQFLTAVETQALCAAVGDTCSTKVSTGSLTVPYGIQQPAFDLQNFNVSAVQAGTSDQLDFSIQVVNNGAPNEPPIVVRFYLDTNGNGSGDLLVHTATSNAVIANGQSLALTGSFGIPAGNLCNLIAYILPDDQCACSGDSAYVTLPIVYQTEQDFIVCSGENVSVGLPGMSGFSYQWTPAGCLANPNASLTTFNCENSTGFPIQYNLTLAAAGPGCQIQHLLAVTLQPQPGILFAETPICAGQTANMAATDGVSYNWTGPGTVPGLQVQSVTPLVTSDYAVTVTDEVGCTGTDAVTIVVNPLPVIDAGKDTLFCPGQIARLNPALVPGYSYAWSPPTIGGLPALSNPNIPDPFVLTNTTTTFTLTVTDPNGCKNTDAVTVSFSDPIVLIVSPDVTICTGSTTVLSASGADFYQWSPPGICQDPPCSSVAVTPAVTTTYTVVASTVDNCLDSATVTVKVVEDVILTEGPPIELCEGGTVVIFGEIVSEPGTYCDTTSLASGCDSVHCILVLVKDPIDTTFQEAVICEGDSFVFHGQALTEAGFYCVNLPGTDDCDSTVCLTLTVLDAPQFELIGPDTIAPGDTVFLFIEPGNFGSILWSGGNITDACTNQPSCTDIPQETTEYFVTVTDANGCTATAAKEVIRALRCEPEKAELPNIFSPNNDGLNDVFTIVSPGSETVLNMRIWNRWGEKVYDGPGPWDGTQNGKPAVSDVYVYLIKVGCPVNVDGEERVLKGDVTLLR